MKKDPLNRFLEKVQVGPLPVEWTGKPEERTECLLWTASIRENGYGQFNTYKKIVRSHRWIYEQCIGSVPKGLDLDHLCRVRSCVNPLHLEPVTRSENMNRSKIQKLSARNSCLLFRKHNLPEGVSPHGKGFQATKRLDGKNKYLGTFSTPEQASKVFKEFIEKNKL